MKLAVQMHFVRLHEARHQPVAADARRAPGAVYEGGDVSRHVEHHHVSHLAGGGGNGVADF